jgi:hypothetical protein
VQLPIPATTSSSKPAKIERVILAVFGPRGGTAANGVLALGGLPAVGATDGRPQAGQNLAPGAMGEPQCAQNVFIGAFFLKTAQAVKQRCA